MASYIDQRAQEITVEKQQEYEQLVKAGQALPGTFESYILKPGRKERRIKWAYQVQTQEGPKKVVRLHDLTLF